MLLLLLLLSRVLDTLDACLQQLTGYVGVDRLQDLFDRLHLGRGLVASVVMIRVIATDLGVADEFRRVLNARIRSLPLPVELSDDSGIHRTCHATCLLLLHRTGERHDPTAQGVSQVGGYQVLVEVGQARCIVTNSRQAVEVVRRRRRGRSWSTCRIVDDRWGESIGSAVASVLKALNGPTATVHLAQARRSGTASANVRRTRRPDCRRGWNGHSRLLQADRQPRAVILHRGDLKLIKKNGEESTDGQIQWKRKSDHPLTLELRMRHFLEVMWDE